MLGKSLGNLHCDLGFFSVTKDYPTPKSYQNGYLICKDIFTKYIYVSILTRDRKAPSIVRAFEDVKRQYEKQVPGSRISCVAFDKERSVMGNIVQNFFKEHKIKFFAFQHSSSKSKIAENGIKLIRTTIARLRTIDGNSLKGWWKLIHPAVNILNNQPIRVGKKFLKYKPSDINLENQDAYAQDQEDASKTLIFSQLAIRREDVESWKYKVGDYVKVKSIVTSSAALGQKRSEINLDPDKFIVLEQKAVLTPSGTIQKLYICRNTEKSYQETFDEYDLALSTK